MIKRFNNQKGLTLLEIVISIAILSIIITPMFSLFINSIKTNKMAEKRMMATQLAQKYLEKEKNNLREHSEEIHIEGDLNIFVTTTKEGTIENSFDIPLDYHFEINSSDIDDIDSVGDPITVYMKFNENEGKINYYIGPNEIAPSNSLNDINDDDIINVKFEWDESRDLTCNLLSTLSNKIGLYIYKDSSASSPIIQPINGIVQEYFVDPDNITKGASIDLAKSYKIVVEVKNSEGQSLAKIASYVARD